MARTLPSAACVEPVSADVLVHRLRLAGERGERAEARLLAEGSAGLLQRIEPFLDDLSGRVPVRQQEDRGTGDVESRAGGAARAGRAHRQGSPAFAQGLSVAFGFAVAACLVAALASLLRGGRYVYGEPAGTAGPPGEGTATGSASPALPR